MMLCFRFTNNSTQSQKNTIYRSYSYDQFGILNFIFAAAIYNKSISYAGFGFGYKIDHHIKLHLSSEHLTNFRIFQIFEAGTTLTLLGNLKLNTFPCAICSQAPEQLGCTHDAKVVQYLNFWLIAQHVSCIQISFPL